MAAAAVLCLYPSPLRGRLAPHRTKHSFSGADIWRVETVGGFLCLRAWPSSQRLRELLFVHELLQAADRLAFVPRLLRTSEGQTWAFVDGRLWELTNWLPGRSGVESPGGAACLEEACRSLAQLHLVWKQSALRAPQSALSPAVLRRRTELELWARLVGRGWRPAWRDDDLIAPVAQRAWSLLDVYAERAMRRLERWQARIVPIQPCLCDPWLGNILFSGDRLTGFVDYGSVKMDHVAVDLARLLGDAAGDDRALREIGLAAYERLQPVEDWVRALIDDLDITGTVCAAAHWLINLYHERRPVDPAAAKARIESLVKRMEKW